MTNAHLPRCPLPSSLRRTSEYASFLRISGALHLGVFDQPGKQCFFGNMEELQYKETRKIGKGGDDKASKWFCKIPLCKGGFRGIWPRLLL